MVLGFLDDRPQPRLPFRRQLEIDTAPVVIAGNPFNHAGARQAIDNRGHARQLDDGHCCDFRDTATIAAVEAGHDAPFGH